MNCKTARFRVKPEELAECLAAIEEFVAAVGANEPDTLLYVSYQEQDDPTRFLHVFAFADQAAEEFHTKTPWVNAFVERLYPRCTETPVFTPYDAVAWAGRT
jgi:quinol monooxygenase YgiN